MEPYKHFLSTEGCSSSESGWTRYLASPMEDESACSEENYSNNHNINEDVDDGDRNSDDSMVSDASSAPNHQHKHKDGQGSHGNVHLKHDKGDYSSKHSSHKEAKKEVKKSAENSSKSKKRLGGQVKSRK